MRDITSRRAYLDAWNADHKQERAKHASRKRAEQAAILTSIPCPSCDMQLSLLQVVDGRRFCSRSCAQWARLPKAGRQPRAEAGKETTWLRTYDLPPEVWRAYGATACDLCGGPLLYSEHGRRLFHIDHDHAHCPSLGGCLECVRGVLCIGCNTQEGAVLAMLAKGMVTVGGPLARYWAHPPFQQWRHGAGRNIAFFKNAVAVTPSSLSPVRVGEF